ncbi:MAG: tetratricopeptide repeat protein [Blastocatellia bacterium]|nr:tetratricopeptide repeat protein [Blastocatellia bacterium]
MRNPLAYLFWFAVATAMLLAWSVTLSSKTAARRVIGSGSSPTSPQSAPARIVPQQPPDPNRAPQSDIDQALLSTEEFFGSQALIERPTQQARERLTHLMRSYPRDAQLRLIAAKLDVRLGETERANEQMRQFVELENRQPSALRTLAIYQHSQAQFANEIATLMELARKSPRHHHRDIFDQIISVIRTHRPAGIDLDRTYRAMFELNPLELAPIVSYVQELSAQRRYEQALAVIAEFRSRFADRPHLLLNEEAAIYLRQNRIDQAVAVYDRLFKPLWEPSLSSAYYKLLKRVGRYRSYRRYWRERYEAGSADVQTLARLFDLYVWEGNAAEANRVLARYEDVADRDRTTPPARELETLAALYARIGNYDQASRYYYTLHLMGVFQTNSPLRESGLYQLFNALMQAQDQPTRVAAGDLSLYKDVATVDQHPGLLNGVLSLILADTAIPEEFREREARAARLFNGLLAYRIFQAFKNEFPQSERLPSMYASLIDTVAQLKRFELAINMGEEFLARFSDSDQYETISLKIADAYRSLNDRHKERLIYRRLLDRLAARRLPGQPLMPVAMEPWTYVLSPRWAASGATATHANFYRPIDEPNSYQEDRPSPPPVSYQSVLERLLASLAQTNEREAILQIYWQEIRKYPHEEGLYEALLRWLEETNLFDEKLQAYQQAIRQFPTAVWYHRLARWLIRQQQREAFRQYSTELVSMLDDAELQPYLEQFIVYSDKPDAAVNYDAQLYWQLYRLAHERFPHNLSFVHGLLRYYQQTKQTNEWQALATRYYFADPQVRDQLLLFWSSNGTLPARYQQARHAAATSSAYRWFGADAAVWMARYEEAVETYRQLAEVYPNDPRHAERLATLLRSLGQTDPENLVRSARLYEQLAKTYPTDQDFRTQAGEAYAEYGDMAAAGQQWDALLVVESGRRETYLQVASLYWDYFAFDGALGAIQRLRSMSGDDTAYAYQMAAIYESKRDISNAISEYVKALAEPGFQQQPVIQRLATLTKQRNLSQSIQQQVEAYARARPDNWSLAVGYEQYLRAIGRVEDAWLFLESEMARRQQEEFLLYARDRFRAGRRQAAQERALNRLVSLARTELDEIKYRLQLVAFHERQGDADRAARIMDECVAKYPTNYGVIDEATDFYWRIGLLNRSIDLYKSVVKRARGGYERQLNLELARRLGEAGRYDEAETILRALYQQDKSDSETFAQLAQLLNTAGKIEALLEWYRAGLTDVQSLPLPRDQQRERIAQIRRAMIELYHTRGDHNAAIDQHIEIINREPENRDLVTAAINDATRWNLTDRLINYYEQTARQSFRNYRWNQVLAWLYEYQGQLDKAAEQYELAARQEPQRLDLRMAYADTLVRLERYDEAIAQFQRGYALSGEQPEWQVKIAQAAARQGRQKLALDALNTALRSTQVNSQRLFGYAAMLESWGLSAEARKFYIAGFDRLMKDFYAEPLIDNRQLDGLVRTAVRAGAAQDTWNRLWKARQWARQEQQREDNYQTWRVEQFQSQLETALRESFGANLARYGQPAEVAQIVSALKARLASLTRYTEQNKAELLLLASLAHRARWPDVQEQVLRQLVDLAFGARQNAQDTRCYDELQSLLNFYDARGAFAQAADVLHSYFSRDPHQGSFDYRSALAWRYRWAGDTDKELAVLRQIYRSQSGAPTDTHDALIERYFTLLYRRGQRDELASLTTSYNPYQLQLVNFLIAQGERELAIAALQPMPMSPAWIRSREAQIAYHFSHTETNVNAQFAACLRAEPIGQLIAAKPDANQTLIGDEWYQTAYVYGLWLELSPATKSKARDYLTALLEQRPRQTSEQLALAEHYLEENELPLALEHARLAEELAPRDIAVTVTLGKILWTQGRQQEALATWERLLTNHPESADAYVASVDALAAHQQHHRPIAALQAFMVEAIQARGFESLRTLTRRIAHLYDAPTAAALFESVIAQTPSNMDLAVMLSEEGLLPEPMLTPFYRAIVMSLREGHVIELPTAEDDEQYEEHSEPPTLERWHRRLIEHLIALSQWNAAEAELAAFESARDPAMPPPDWFTLNLAQVEIHQGQRASAIKRLREFAAAGSPLQPARFVKAAAVLKEAGLHREAHELLLEIYSSLLTSGQVNDVNFVGLAEALFHLERGEEALATLERMVNRAADPLPALALAGEIAFRYNRPAEAVRYRQRLAKLNPEWIENRIELARAQAAAGSLGAAVETLAALLTDRRTPSEQVAVALLLLPRLAAGQEQLALTQLQGPSERLISARVALLKNADQARQLLSPLLNDRYNLLAKIQRALIDPDTPALWQNVLWSDPDQVVTNYILFATPSPRAQLIELYTRAARYEAALKMAQYLPDVARLSEEDEDEQQAEYEQEADRAADQTRATETTQVSLMSSDQANRWLLKQVNLLAQQRHLIQLLESLARAAAELNEYDRAIGYLKRMQALVADESEQRRANELLAVIHAKREQYQRQLAQRMTITTKAVNLGARLKRG